MQKLLTLIIVVLILYNIIKIKTTASLEELNKNSKNDTEQTVKNESNPENILLEGNLIEKALSRVVINALKTDAGKEFFENIIQPLNKPLNTEDYSIEVEKDLVTPLFQITTSGKGNIGPAICGHVVTIYYQLLDMNDSLLLEGDKTFTLGSDAIMIGIDNVVVGMMVGQAREAIIPAKYAYYSEEYRKKSLTPDTPFKVKVVLKSIMPQNFIKSDEVKIFDNEIAYRKPLLCGEKISFNAKIIRLANGKVMYDSKLNGEKIDIKIGDITYPLILSYALHGKVPVGMRTVLAKGKTFQATGSKLNKIITNNAIPTDEYFMLELTDFKEINK